MSRRKCIRIASTVAAVLALALPVVAQAGFTPPQLINNTGPVGASRVAVDPRGNMLVVWDQEVAPGNLDGVRARFVSVTGAVGPVLEISTPGGDQFQPAVASAPNGRMFVAWRTSPASGDATGVNARWVEPDGTLGPVVPLLVGVNGSVDAVEIVTAVDQAGVGTAAWRNQAGGDTLSASRVGADSVASGPINGIAGGVLGLQIAALPDGSSLFAWRGAGIKSIVVSPAGTFGTPIDLTEPPTSGLGDPGLAADSAGNAVATWRESDAGSSNWGVMGRRLAPTGAPAGGELEIEPLAPGFVGVEALVAADSINDFLATWVRDDSAGDAIAYARRLDKDGSFAGPAQPLSEAVNAQFAVPMLFDAGPAAVSWKSDVAGGFLTQGRELNALGVPVGPIVPLVTPLLDAGIGAGNPAAGVAGFVTDYNTGPDATIHLTRFLLPPACAQTQATVTQGRLVDVPLPCTGISVEGYEIVTPPQHGGLGSVNATGSVPYTPVRDFDGGDSFTYRAFNDGGASEVATAQLNVASGLDKVVPGIRSMRFRQQTVRGSLAQAAGRRRRRTRARRRFTVLLTYSEPASAVVTVERPVRGVRRGRRCLPRTRTRRRGRRCTLYRRVGTTSTRALRSSSSMRVSGRLLRRLSRGGRFRLTAVATDAAANKSVPRRLRVRIRRLRR
jgi:hypothetical protein